MPSSVPMRGLRMDDELYLKLKFLAAKDSRSYNQEAVYILKSYVAEYEAQHGVIDVDTNVLYHLSIPGCSVRQRRFHICPYWPCLF